MLIIIDSGSLEINGDMTVGFLAVRTGAQPLFADQIMDHLAFEGIHRLQIDRLAGLAHFVDGIKRNIAQVLTLVLEESVNIHNEM